MQSLDTASRAAREASLTDVDGILVGHFTSAARPTGCTVITAVKPFVAGVDVRGGAPGTRETDLLRAENMVTEVNALFLSGGSAFGLDVATGVSRFLEEKGRGFQVGAIRIPIVSGAILFDLGLGDPQIRPDGQAGYDAARTASADPVAEGNVGAGAGATIGKMLGHGHAMKGGLGSWAWSRSDGLRVGALVAVNALGDIVDPTTGKIIAGARKADGTGFADSMMLMRQGLGPFEGERNNTVIGVVATNAKFNKAQCSKIAQMAQDALARCIYPSHMPWDGDTIFAISTGTFSPTEKPPDVGIVGALAADVLALAILRGIKRAETWGSVPAARDFPG